MKQQDDNNSDFTVFKNTYTFKTCSDCNGKGTKKRSFRKMEFVYNCHTCKGSGKEKVKSTEEVSLAEALKEINNQNQ